MILVDVHAHMEMYEKGLGEVVGRASSAGVVAVLTQGVHHASNKKVLELCAKYKLLKPCMGLYPLDAKNVAVHGEYKHNFNRERSPSVDETLGFIKEHGKEISCIGEVGIDLKNSDDEEHQVENFTKILRLSNQLQKVCNIHSRKAEKLVLDILEDAKSTRHVLHCFSGSKKLIRRAVALGCFLTVTSNANRLQHFQMMAREVPLSQLLTETDSPYLSPIPEELNEPQNVRVAVETIAKEKRLTPEEVAKAVYMNYQRLF